MCTPIKYHAPCCDRRTFNGECFLPEICKEYSNIVRRHECFQPKSCRLRIMAEPKYHMKKFVHKCECFDEKKPIYELIREVPRQTRTEQLAYPLTRKLLLLRGQFRNVLEENRIVRINRNIRRSFFTVYSRLANRQPPPPRVSIKKWTKRQWRRHTRYYRKLAKPKNVPTPPKPLPVWKPLEKMSRYIKLAVPRDRIDEPKVPWKITEGVRHFEPSPRLQALGLPRELSPDYQAPAVLPLKVPRPALKYKPTPRILELAKPFQYMGKEADMKENPFGVAPDALTYRISKRTKNLAQPREFEDTHTRTNPNQISPAALNAKPTPRLIELSKPRNSNKEP